MTICYGLWSVSFQVLVFAYKLLFQPIGKKSKKVRGKTLALNDFLASTPTTLATKSWADEEDDFGENSIIV